VTTKNRIERIIFSCLCILTDKDFNETVFLDKKSCHSTKYFFRANNIRRFKTPAQSLDFNPLELVWNALGDYLTNHLKPSNAEELRNGILQLWRSVVTPEYCNSKIDHLQTVFRKCLEFRGNATGL
jgi:hypothetical protein